MTLTARELADRLGAALVGDPERVVRAVRPLESAGPEDLSFLHNPKYVAQARSSAAGVIVVADAGALPGRTLIVTPQPYLATARAVEILHPPSRPEPGVHPAAVVAPDATLGSQVSVGPCAVIGSGCRLGDRTVVGAGVVLGCDVEVGEDCWLHPRVVVEDACRVGARCILHAGVVIGADGFGFATVDGVHHKVPQVGIVVLEDDVELGANVCVDRATLGETRIGRGTKVDNLVQVGHNVRVGERSLLVAQAGIAGSTSLGHHVVMAGQSGVAGHVRIGDGAQIAAKAAVFKDVPAGQLYSGIPARPHREWMRSHASLARLERLRERVAALESALAEALRVRRDEGPQ